MFAKLKLGNFFGKVLALEWFSQNLQTRSFFAKILSDWFFSLSWFIELLVFLPVLPRGKRLCKKIEDLFFSISLVFFLLFCSVQREVLLILCNIWEYNFGLNWEPICEWQLEINKAVNLFCRIHFCIQSTQPSYTISSSLMILFEPAMQGRAIACQASADC
jgi:hypothetical protein